MTYHGMYICTNVEINHDFIHHVLYIYIFIVEPKKFALLFEFNHIPIDDGTNIEQTMVKYIYCNLFTWKTLF